MELPLINEDHQSWCCNNGCGTCAPVQVDQEYSRTEYPDGRKDIRTEKAWVSDCCKVEMMVWDELKQDTIEPSEVESINLADALELQDLKDREFMNTNAAGTMALLNSVSAMIASGSS